MSGTEISIRARPATVMVMNTVSVAGVAITAAPVEGTGGAPNISRRPAWDLSVGANQWRVNARIITPASAAAKFAIQWSLNQTDWFYLDGVASGSAPGAGAYVSMANATTLSGSWVTIPVTAKADVTLRCVTFDGDGATSGAVGHASLQVR